MNYTEFLAKIKRNTLKIRHKLDHLLNRTYTYVELYHNSSLDEISLYQGSTLKTDSVHKQTSVSIKVAEGSTMNFAFEGQKISSVVITGGHLYLKGNATNHESAVNSGGSCEADSLSTDLTRVSVTAGGLSYVRASQLVEAKVVRDVS